LVLCLAASIISKVDFSSDKLLGIIRPNFIGSLQGENSSKLPPTSDSINQKPFSRKELSLRSFPDRFATCDKNLLHNFSWACSRIHEKIDGAVIYGLIDTNKLAHTLHGSFYSFTFLSHSLATELHN
jgi:hypothetical protein